MKKKGIVLKGFKLSPEAAAKIQAELDRREFRRNVKGPCTCGEPEKTRCDLCKGPACTRGIWDDDDDNSFCCECFNKAAC